MKADRWMDRQIFAILESLSRLKSPQVQAENAKLALILRVNVQKKLAALKSEIYIFIGKIVETIDTFLDG